MPLEHGPSIASAEHAAEHADGPKVARWVAMLRGLRLKCPACGAGRLFRAYLKVAEHCPDCGERLGHIRADDAPPYFTILIVGHILVPVVLMVERSYTPPLWLSALMWLPSVFVLMCLLLPHVKGALIGLMWSLGLSGDEHQGCEIDTGRP